MGDGSAVVIESVGGPDAAVGIVEAVVVGVEVALLPGEMSRQHGPHLPHEDRIGIILEVPEQFVDVVQVHVVVMHLVGAVRVAADIAVGVHLRAPRLDSPRQTLPGVLRGMGDGGFHAGDLTVGVGREMGKGTVGQAQHVAEIAGPPSAEGHSPGDGSVEPHLSVPGPVGSGHQRPAEGVDVGVGGVEDDLSGQPVVMLHGCRIEGFRFCLRRSA